MYEINNIYFFWLWMLYFYNHTYFSSCFHPFSSVQYRHSVVSDSATPWIPARQASLFITISQSLLRLMSIESVMPFNHLILCRPLLLLPLIFPSIWVFPNEWALHSGQSWASASVLLMNIQAWFPLGLTGLISLLSKGLSRVFPAWQFRSISSSALSLLHGPVYSSVSVYSKS